MDHLAEVVFLASHFPKCLHWQTQWGLYLGLFFFFYIKWGEGKMGSE